MDSNTQKHSTQETQKAVTTVNLWEASFILFKDPTSYFKVTKRTQTRKDRETVVLTFYFKPTKKVLEARDIYRHPERSLSEEANAPIGMIQRLREELVRKART